MRARDPTTIRRQGDGTSPIAGLRSLSLLKNPKRWKRLGNVQGTVISDLSLLKNPKRWKKGAQPSRSRAATNQASWRRSSWRGLLSGASTPDDSRLITPETTPPSIPTNPATGPRRDRGVSRGFLAQRCSNYDARAARRSDCGVRPNFANTMISLRKRILTGSRSAPIVTPVGIGKYKKVRELTCLSPGSSFGAFSHP
jgi:hypothetical protein